MCRAAGAARCPGHGPTTRPRQTSPRRAASSYPDALDEHAPAVRQRDHLLRPAGKELVDRARGARARREAVVVAEQEAAGVQARVEELDARLRRLEDVDVDVD